MAKSKKINDADESIVENVGTEQSGKINHTHEPTINNVGTEESKETVENNVNDAHKSIIKNIGTEEGKERVKGYFGRLIDATWRFLRGRFDLREDSAPQAEVVEIVRKGVHFRGANLWILIFAVFIASLGLNVNSTAVIIGAMLISPLMGPILGVGLSLGVNDFDMLKSSLRNFLLMTVVSLLTSTLYFVISPINTAQSELLARTVPTTYDVLIAFFGGMAGIVAQTRRDKTFTVISGVAIATALMPPLCTAGFGIATGNGQYFLGAIYLFIINSIFISLATYLLAVFLKYRKKEFIDKAREKKVRRIMALIITITIIPSLIVGFTIIRRTTFEDNVDRFINRVFQFDQTMIVDYEKFYHYDGKKSKIEVKLVGETLSHDAINNLSAQLEDFNIHNTELAIRQADKGLELDITTIQKSYAEIIDAKNSTINELRAKIAGYQTVDTIAVSDISKEMAVVIDNVEDISLSKQVVYNTEGNPIDTTIICFITPKSRFSPLDINRAKLWLCVRTKSDDIEIIVNNPKK